MSWPWLMFHYINSREVDKSSQSGPWLCENSPQRPGWWHVDDMFIWCVYQSSKSPQASSVWKNDSLSGAPCVFREKGACLGVNSVTLGDFDRAGLTPEFLWTGQPRVTLQASLLRDLHMKGRGFRGSQRTAMSVYIFFLCGVSYIKTKIQWLHDRLYVLYVCMCFI